MFYLFFLPFYSSYADQTAYCYSPVFYDMNGYPIAMYFVPVFYYIVPVNYIPVTYTAIDVPTQYYDARDFRDPNDFECMPLENRYLIIK